MSLRYAALGLLAQHPGSGYDLLRRFELSMGNVWSATQSQLYTELNKLAGDGLIEVTSVGARGRKEYAITEAGRAALRAWVSEPDPEPIRNRRLLRVFMLGEVPPAQARAFFEQTVAASERTLAELQGLREDVAWSDTASDRYGRIALEWGVRAASMERDWAQWALGELDADGASAGHDEGHSVG